MKRYEQSKNDDLLGNRLKLHWCTLMRNAYFSSNVTLNQIKRVFKQKNYQSAGVAVFTLLISLRCVSISPGKGNIYWSTYLIKNGMKKRIKHSNAMFLNEFKDTSSVLKYEIIYLRNYCIKLGRLYIYFVAQFSIRKTLQKRHFSSDKIYFFFNKTVLNCVKALADIFYIM